MPVNQLMMMKLLVNQTLYSPRVCTPPRCWAPSSTASPATRAEGYAFQQRAAEAGFREAVRERDEPFGDRGARPSRAERRGGRGDGSAVARRPGTGAPRRICGPRSSPVKWLADPALDRRGRRRLEWALPADVAQLARASPCHGEGRGFESLHPLLEKTPQMRGFLRSRGGTIAVSLPLGDTLGYRLS